MVKMINVGDLRMYSHEFYANDGKNIDKSVSLYCARAKVGDWKMMELDRCVSSRQILIHIFLRLESVAHYFSKIKILRLRQK